MNLWMRWVDFRALRDLLLLVDSAPDGLRARDIERLATEQRVLVRRDGRPYARSTHYHHRRTLERLGLLEKRGGAIALNERNPETGALTARPGLHEPLSALEKEAFGNAILRNRDCHDVFFTSFIESPDPAPDVTTFVRCGEPVEMSIRRSTTAVDDEHPRDQGYGGGKKSRHVAIRRTGEREWRILQGAKAVQAVHFGLRSWCADQLGFVDVTCAADGTYTLYPKHIVPQLTAQELAAAMFDAIDFDGDWAMVRIPDCALETGIRQRVSVEQAKDVLAEWLTEHPDLVAGVATRVGFITSGLPDRQHALALRGYLRSRNGAYLSHLRIHRTLREHVQSEGRRP